MLLVRRSLKGWTRPPENFVVFERQEADLLGLQYAPWRASRTRSLEGELVSSDDGFVGLCFRSRLYGAQSVGQVRYSATCMGDFWSTQRRWVAWPAIESGCQKGKGIIPRELRRVRTQTALRSYALLMVRQRGLLTKEQFRTLAGFAMSPWYKKPQFFKRLLRQKEVIEYVSDRIAEIIGDLGPSFEELMTGYLDLIEIAKEKGDLKMARSTLDHLLALKFGFASVSEMEQRPQGLLPERVRAPAVEEMNNTFLPVIPVIVEEEEL